MSKTDTTIDQDLYDGLQQARKKKPRYFALIAKGADVVGLIVQKKVINDGAAQKAKSECKGTLVIQGVCCGEGVELKFEVEGEEPSILPKKIKDFIEEQTDLTLKPQWVAVQKLSSVQDDEGQPATDQAPARQSAGSGRAGHSSGPTAWAGRPGRCQGSASPAQRASDATAGLVRQESGLPREVSKILSAGDEPDHERQRRCARGSRQAGAGTQHRRARNAAAGTIRAATARIRRQ